jgi:GntR family transcriptional regulator, transcriptional repressor for pyruvate dehydrogenase complex
VGAENLDFVPRAHVSDHVFDKLARAILEGELAPGTAMPPERLLVERFGVSRILVRQAVHRLAEMGLVRVRQGGATLVLDPHQATDLRVLALFYRLAKHTGRAEADTADMIEKQYLQGLSIVEVASRRAGAAELRAIADLVEAASHDEEALADFAAFEERFWRALSLAAKNRIFRMEVAWWYEMLDDRPVPTEVASLAPLDRIAFYRELTRRLVDREYPVEYYLATVRPLLDAVLARANALPARSPR